MLTGSSDKPDLHLSKQQRRILAGWERPSELLSKHANSIHGLKSRMPVMSVSGTTDLVQDMLTDCSVVASLCAATSRSERGLDKV